VTERRPTRGAAADGQGAPAIFALGILGVAVTGGLDWVTGYEVRIFPLYFLPVAYVAWNLSRPSAIGIACLSTAAWALSNSLAGREYSSSWIWPVNILTQLVAFATVSVLVTELRRSLRLERELSRTDALTGLLNARAFREQGELLFAIARRTKRPLTLAYLDLDGFKQINDERGHQQGDQALLAVAETLKADVRKSDLIARVGGDEFALVLPETGADGARTTLERVRARIATRMQQSGWPATVSVGALAYPEGPPDLDEAIQDADALMYRAKEAGKDRVHVELGHAPPRQQHGTP